MSGSEVLLSSPNKLTYSSTQNITLVVWNNSKNHEFIIQTFGQKTNVNVSYNFL